MTSYSVKFVNDRSTGRTWTMAIYQTIPNMNAFQNVMWRLATVSSGSNKSLAWMVAYNAVLPEVYSGGGIVVYEPRQMLSSELGQAWQYVNRDGVQQLVSVGAAPAGSISIANASSQNASVGIGIDGSGSIYQPDLQPNATAQFNVTPRYWAALYSDCVSGQAVSTAFAATSRVELSFASGVTSITLTAWVENDNLYFGNKSGLPSAVPTPMTQVTEHTRLSHEAFAELRANRPHLFATPE